jgi:hypothetical protein
MALLIGGNKSYVGRDYVGAGNYELITSVAAIAIAGQNANTLVGRKAITSVTAFDVAGQNLTALKTGRKLSAQVQTFALDMKDVEGLFYEKRNTGWKEIGTATDNASWDNPNNIQLEDGTYTQELLDNGTGNYNQLKVTIKEEGSEVGTSKFRSIPSAPNQFIYLGGETDVWDYRLSYNQINDFGGFTIRLYDSVNDITSNELVLDNMGFTIPSDTLVTGYGIRIKCYQDGTNVYLDYAEMKVYYNLLVYYTLTAEKTDFVMAAQNLTALKADRKLLTQKQDFDITTVDTGLFANRKLTTQKQDFDIQTINTGLLFGRKLSAAKTDLVIDTVDASLLYGRVLSTSAQTVTLAMQDALLLFGYKLITELGTVSIDGKTVNFPRTYVLRALKGEIIIEGQDAILTYERNGEILETISTNWAIATQSVNFKVNRWASIPAVQVLYDGSIVINGIVRI